MAGFVSTITGSLGTGVLSVLAAVPISTALLLFAYRSVPQAEATMVERARAAGEPV
jgi:ABC-type phosphate transport system permease subunit